MPQYKVCVEFELDIMSPEQAKRLVNQITEPHNLIQIANIIGATIYMSPELAEMAIEDNPIAQERLGEVEWQRERSD